MKYKIINFIYLFNKINNYFIPRFEILFLIIILNLNIFNLLFDFIKIIINLNL